MGNDYFLRVTSQTPTRFWINNPTRKEADLALEAGASGCTNNPSYSWKMLQDPQEKEYALKLLNEAIIETSDDDEAAAAFQRKLVKPIQEKFLPIWKSTGGRDGHVSIQGDPIREDDPQVVINEARKNLLLGPNICIKIPTTVSGLKAMETLIAEDVSINATEIMGISQGIALCETYSDISKQTKKRPMLYLSHIAGIYDDHLNNCVQKENINISRDVLNQAGLAVARKMYQIIQERGYETKMIGGGARAPRHFTEMVGGDLVVTINWKGTADLLLQQDMDVVFRFFNPVAQHVIDELVEKLPDFRRGYYSTGLGVEEFENFGPVVLFRNSFTNSWNNVLGLINKMRSRH